MPFLLCSQPVTIENKATLFHIPQFPKFYFKPHGISTKSLDLHRGSGALFADNGIEVCNGELFWDFKQKNGLYPLKIHKF